MVVVLVEGRVEGKEKLAHSTLSCLGALGATYSKSPTTPLSKVRGGGAAKPAISDENRWGRWGQARLPQIVACPGTGNNTWAV